MDEGPYRQSGAIACPRCATPLGREPDGAMTCSAGCGAWFATDVFVELLGPVLDDARTPSAWWKKRPSGPCPVCGEELLQRVLGEIALFRCAPHGIWLDHGTRERLERELADELARHRSALELAAQLAKGDADAIRAFAIRFVALEHRVALLEKLNQVS